MSGSTVVTDFTYNQTGAVNEIVKTDTSTQEIISTEKFRYTAGGLVMQFIKEGDKEEYPCDIDETNMTYADHWDWRYRYSAVGGREQKRLYYSPHGDSSVVNPDPESVVDCSFSHPWEYYLRGAGGEVLAVYSGRQTVGPGEYSERRVYMYANSYLVNGGQMVRLANGCKEFAVNDNLGSVRAVINVDTSNNVSARHYDYKPYGDTLNTTEDTELRQGFIGSQLDQESRYIAMGARMYDPESGRFLSVDPLFELFTEHTPYHYAYNSPLIFKDPSGLAVELEAVGYSMGYWVQMEYSILASDTHSDPMDDNPLDFCFWKTCSQWVWMSGAGGGSGSTIMNKPENLNAGTPHNDGSSGGNNAHGKKDEEDNVETKVIGSRSRMQDILKSIKRDIDALAYCGAMTGFEFSMVALENAWGYHSCKNLSTGTKKDTVARVNPRLIAQDHHAYDGIGNPKSVYTDLSGLDPWTDFVIGSFHNHPYEVLFSARDVDNFYKRISLASSGHFETGSFTGLITEHYVFVLEVTSIEKFKKWYNEHSSIGSGLYKTLENDGTWDSYLIDGWDYADIEKQIKSIQKFIKDSGLILHQFKWDFGGLYN